MIYGKEYELVAKRKSPSKKATKKTSDEGIVIDGVAEEVNPADVKPKQAREKSASTFADKKSNTKPMPSFILSLIALLFGITGAGLGALAYLSVTGSSSQTDNVEITQKIVEDRLGVMLTPLYEQISNLEASISGLAASHKINQDELANVNDDITKIRATLTGLEQSTPSQGGADSTLNKAHNHEDYVRLDDLNKQIALLKLEIETLKNAQKGLQTSAINPGPQPDENAGWWDNLLGAFSITRIETSPDQETE